MGVSPLRGPFQTPKIGVGGSVARTCNIGLCFGPASGTGQTSKCNQKGRNQRMLQYRSVLKEQKKKTVTHVQALVVKMPFWS